MSRANSTSLLTVDSTRQHGAHAFDVNCRICTGRSDTSSRPLGLPAIHTSSVATASVMKDSDSSSQDVGKNDRSPRKKICLAQRLKMYSTELQRNGVDKQTGDKRVCDVEAGAAGVKRSDEMQSSDDLALDSPTLSSDDADWLTQAVNRLQKENSAKEKNAAAEQKLEQSSAVACDESRTHSTSASTTSSQTKQQQCSTSPQETRSSKHRTTPAYVAVYSSLLILVSYGNKTL